MTQVRLKRELGLASATAMVVGEVIAVGIFLTPAEMIKSLGSPMWVLVVWLAMGLMALSGALCYGQLAARFPEAGGGYVYLREAYGRRLAFLYGWKSFLVMDPGLTAALAVGAASYAGYIVQFSERGVKAAAIGAIAASAAANILGVRLGARILRGLTALKIGALVFIIVWAFAGSAGDWSNFLPFTGQRAGSLPLTGGLAAGMVAGFFSFGGWWDLNKMAGEIREPSHTLPRAIALGVIAVTIIYLATSAAFIYLVTFERVHSSETFAAQAGEALFGAAGAGIFSAVVVISVLGSLMAVTMTAPRVYYAMAMDGLFFNAAKEVHPRFGTPVRAIALQAVLACLVVMAGTFQQIIAYFVFVTVIFVGLTVASVFVIRRRDGIPRRPVPGYPITPMLFLTLVAVLLVLLAWHNPLQSALGAAIVSLGLPVYEIVVRRRASNVSEHQ